MKINIVIPFTDITGGIRIIFEYANRLSEKGHDVVLYYPLVPYSIYYKGAVNKLRQGKVLAKNITKRDRVNWFDLKAKLKAVPYIHNKYIEDGDVVIATAWPTSYEVESFHSSKGKKVYFVQDYEIWHGEKALVDDSYRLPMQKIVIAKWLQELLENDLGAKNIELIYNGIDLKEFYNENKTFDNKPKIVTMLYHALESKGVEDGFKAFEKIREKNNDVKLVLFGTHKGNNIPEYAEFNLKPTREELREIYSKSDVFLFTSRSEGWGLTPLEAMACKCAVVATNTGAIKEVGKHGVNMLISEPKDIDALAKNIQTALDDEALLKNISINGYETVKKMSWENSVDRFERVIF